MTKITGNTYSAKNLLKSAGFTFDAGAKAWYGNEEALAELERISTATYSRTNQKLRAGLQIEKI